MSLLFVAATSGYLMATGHFSDDLSRLGSAEPTAEDLKLVGATSVCQLRAPDRYEDESVAPTNVYIKRNWRETSSRELEIVYPREWAGTLAFNLFVENGFGGSGPLTWVSEPKPIKFAMGITDVLADDGPSAILFIDSDTKPMMGDCRAASELKA